MRGYSSYMLNATHTYRIHVTTADLAAFEFAAGRYGWAPDQFGEVIEFEIEGAKSYLIGMTESEAWEWKESVDADDTAFACASRELAVKLSDLYYSIV